MFNWDSLHLNDWTEVVLGKVKGNGSNQGLCEEKGRLMTVFVSREASLQMMSALS